METVLVVGASGNIGVSAIIAALGSGRNVLAIVRNEASQEKLLKHVEKPEGITFVEADITADDGIQGVVDKVKAGDLPAFQHVFATAGLLNWTSPIQNLELDAFREVMKVSLEANYLAYRATVPYLIEQANPKATWTLMTGGAGDIGIAGVTAIGQGALYSLANVACLENLKTNIRFNEIYLSCRVDYDSVAEEKGAGASMKASVFASVYERVLRDEGIHASRVSVKSVADVEHVKYEKKLPEFMRTTF